jgi:hypothetical protein
MYIYIQSKSENPASYNVYDLPPNVNIGQWEGRE